jgi:hypothetical protein
MKVWKALTTPELLAKWLPEANDCEILTAELNRLLRCGAGDFALPYASRANGMRLRNLLRRAAR